jgi:N,N-dimethylformamidase
MGSALTRRSFLQATAATTAAATVSSLLAASPADAQASYDPQQRFVSLVPGGNGIIYARQADGTLLWYRHTGWQNGAATWANGGNGRVIGTGWNIFSTILANSDGQIFGFQADGTLRWYKYQVSNLTTGAGSWAGGGSGPVIGSGFDSYPRIIGGWNAQFFCIDNAGDMWWFQYTAGNGSAGATAWAGRGLPQHIGSGWLPVKRAWTEPNGVIYAVDQVGNLTWYRHLSGASWANNGNGVIIGASWGEDSQKVAFAGGSGVLYALMLSNDQLNGTDSTLNWYRLTNSQTVTPSSGGIWASGGRGSAIGSGFTYEATASLQGYAANLSVAQGSSQTIAVSTTFPSYTWSVVRLAASASGPVTVMGPTQAAGQLQLLPSGYRASGCGWTGPQFTIPTTWQSGVYAAVLTAPSGQVYYAPFVVRPSAPAASVAWLMPANTYNAYNVWAGHDRYSTQDGVNNVTLTLQRPATTMQAGDPAVIDHTLYNDLFLLSWMSANNVVFDCYSDGDLDASGSWLTSYKALVVGGHPEYWSDNMRASVETYLNGGGRLICPGGNAFYERATIANTGTAVTYTSLRHRDVFTNLDEPESQIVGALWNAAAYLTFAPYQVDNASHPLLAGTGLANGGQFGFTGYNVAASGWEVNGPIDTANVQGTATLLAHGAGQPGGGAAMVYIDRGNGGWVFSANSIGFNGALAKDQALSKIMQNVFTAAVA